jgi:tripartite-type tricarboxylate transporter receptor subunit TctC
VARISFLRRATVIGLMALAPIAAVAQSANWPTRPISALIGYPAGGGTDAAARALEAELRKQLGQPIVIQNLPGAGGAIAMQKLLSSPRDGYTIAIVAGSDLILTPMTLSNAGYQLSDVDVLVPMMQTPFVLAVRPDLDVKDLDDLVARHGSASQPLRYASNGEGSQTHLMTEGVAQRLGLQMVHVPYKGMPPMVSDLSGGHVDLAVLPMVGPVPNLVTSGKLRPIAVFSRERLPILKSVPTILETKKAKLDDVLSQIWIAIVAPKDIPTDVAARIAQGGAAAVASPAFGDFVAGIGATRFPTMTKEERTAFMTREVKILQSLANAVKRPN